MIIGEFNDAYPPELDGVGMVVKSYAQELSQMGDECYYIAPNDPDYKNELTFRTLLFRGIKMHDEPYHVGVPLLDPHYLIRENRIKFDVVHAHSPFTAGLEALRISRDRKIPLIATFHSKYYDDIYSKTHSELLAGFGTNLVVTFYNHCDEVWAVNEKTADVLREYGYKREIRIMPNGTNIDTPDPRVVGEIERRYGLAAGEPVFVFVGQMNWKKNQHRVLEAVALFAKERKCRLFMVGQGPDEEAIREEAARLGLADTVIFTGHISDRKRLLAIVSRADLMIFPSLYDNAPMVVREAASVGTPAILVRNSCASEGVTDGFNGLLCEDTAESVCACMKRGLAEKDVIGENAKKTIPIAWRPIIEKARERYEYLIGLKNMGR